MRKACLKAADATNPPMSSDNQDKGGNGLGQELDRLRKRNQRFNIASTIIWLSMIVLALCLFFAWLPY